MMDDHWAQWMEWLTFDEGLWAEQYWEMCWLLEVWPEYLDRLDLHCVHGSLGEYQGKIDLREVSHH